MRTDASTEKPPPCSHCAIASASSAGSRPRRTKGRSKAPARLRLDFGDGGGIVPGDGMEDDPARRGRVEHAVDDDTMEVKVRVEGGTEAVDEGDCAEARRGPAPGLPARRQDSTARRNRRRAAP